jgi:hypothetical protein
LTLSVALLASGIVCLTLAALTVFLVGPVVAFPTCLGGTCCRTILMATVTVTADERLGLTTLAMKQSGGGTHQLER